MNESKKRSGGQALPDGLKSRIRSTGVFHQREAKHLASKSKRLDLCSAQIAHILHISGLTGEFPVREKTCVEIGSGWVLSHALVLHLLGAKRVIATDIEPIAYPSALHQSIHGSTISIIRDILSPFEEHDIIRERLNKLVAIKVFSFNVLKELGIEYVAPIDLAARSLDTTYDLVISNSVLEHVPISDVKPFLENLSGNLSAGGKMIHCVHLEDHKNIINAPFDFLSEPENTYTTDVQNTRGNRIRRSQWVDILSQVKDMEFRLIYEWHRNDKKLPAALAPQFQDMDDMDLRTSHLGILGTKKPKPRV